MSLPALQVRCPRCQGLNLAPPHLAGSTQACAVCRAPFVVPHGIAQPLPVGPMNGPLPPHLRSLAVSPPVATSPAQASPESPPQEVRKPSRWIGAIMRISLLAIAASLITAIVLIPRAIESFQKAQAKQKQNEPPPEVVEIPEIRPDIPQPIHWVDAAESSSQRTGMNVRITRCEYRPVMARDNLNQAMIAGPGEFLQIHLLITNRYKSKVRYVSWYGNTFRDGNEQVTAKLSGNEREYPQQQFGGVKTIQSHVDDVTLEPGESTNDVLVFALPETKGSGGEELRLELPAAAIGRTGWFHFKLTRELWKR